MGTTEFLHETEELTSDGATAFMMNVENGKITYYSSSDVLAENIYDKWCDFIVSHDYHSGKIAISIKVSGKTYSTNKLANKGRGGPNYPKFGIYSKSNASPEMHI